MNVENGQYESPQANNHVSREKKGTQKERL